MRGGGYHPYSSVMSPTMGLSSAPEFAYLEITMQRLSTDQEKLCQTVTYDQHEMPSPLIKSGQKKP